jgi:hypothetical protein
MKSDKMLFTFRNVTTAGVWTSGGGTGTPTHCTVSEAGGMNYEALCGKKKKEKNDTLCL